MVFGSAPDGRTASRRWPSPSSFAADRAQLWQANLKPFFPAASFKSTGGWLVFDSGPDAPKLGDRLAQEIAKPRQRVAVRGRELAAAGRVVSAIEIALGLPETQLQVTAAGRESAH